MECKFTVGQKVVCIKTPKKNYPDDIIPVAGKIYTIREVLMGWNSGQFIPAVYLNEIHNNPTRRNTGRTIEMVEVSFGAICFKSLEDIENESRLNAKVNRGMEVFKGILANPKIKIKEDA